MRKTQIVCILSALSVVSSIGYAYISERWPVSSCFPSAFESPEEGKKYYANPEKLVVQPWQGRHNVYGIFMIPNGYKTDHLVTLTTPDGQTYCGHMITTRSAANVGIYPKPGYSLMKGYLNTRVAFWLILQGKGSQLKQPSSWKLGYVEKQG